MLMNTLNKFSVVVSMLSLVALTSCATDITPVVTGGSKSDGVVTLGYQYGYFQKPHVNMVAANSKAQQRCVAWGYSRAEAFDGVETLCFQRNALGTCLEGRVKIQYQCIN